MKPSKSGKIIKRFYLFTLILLLSIISKSQSNFQVQTQQDLSGKMYAFVLEPSFPSFIRYCRQTEDKLGWEERKTLPKSPQYGGKFIQFCTAVNRNGKIFIFSLDIEGNVLYTYQNDPGSDTWSGWTYLNCCGIPDMKVSSGQILQISLQINTNGSLLLFALTKDHGVFFNQELLQETNSAFSWTGWRALWGSNLRQIVSSRNTSGRILLFALSNDGSVYYCWQSEPASLSWNNWESLGGSELQKIEVNRNLDGKLYLFAIGGDKRVYMKEQVYLNAWGEWTTLNGSEVKDIFSELSKAGRLSVFAKHTNSSLDHSWQYEPGGANWSDWVILGSRFSFIDAGKFSDGRMVLVATNTVEVYYNSQISPDGAWKGWDLLFKLF